MRLIATMAAITANILVRFFIRSPPLDEEMGDRQLEPSSPHVAVVVPSGTSDAGARLLQVDRHHPPVDPAELDQLAAAALALVADRHATSIGKPRAARSRALPRK